MKIYTNSSSQPEVLLQWKHVGVADHMITDSTVSMTTYKNNASDVMNTETDVILVRSCDTPSLLRSPVLCIRLQVPDDCAGSRTHSD